jgi:hypothetical protein
LSEGIELLLVA